MYYLKYCSSWIARLENVIQYKVNICAHQPCIIVTCPFPTCHIRKYNLASWIRVSFPLRHSTCSTIYIVQPSDPAHHQSRRRAVCGLCARLPADNQVNYSTTMGGATTGEKNAERTPRKGRSRRLGRSWHCSRSRTRRTWRLWRWACWAPWVTACPRRWGCSSPAGSPTTSAAGPRSWTTSPPGSMR